MIGLYILLGGITLTAVIITVLDEIARRQERHRAPKS